MLTNPRDAAWGDAGPGSISPHDETIAWLRSIDHNMARVAALLERYAPTLDALDARVNKRPRFDRSKRDG